MRTARRPGGCAAAWPLHRLSPLAASTPAEVPRVHLAGWDDSVHSCAWRYPPCKKQLLFGTATAVARISACSFLVGVSVSVCCFRFSCCFLQRCSFSRRLSAVERTQNDQSDKVASNWDIQTEEWSLISPSLPLLSPASPSTSSLSRRPHPVSEDAGFVTCPVVEPSGQDGGDRPAAACHSRQMYWLGTGLERPILRPGIKAAEIGGVGPKAVGPHVILINLM